LSSYASGYISDRPIRIVVKHTDGGYFYVSFWYGSKEDFFWWSENGIEELIK